MRALPVQIKDLFALPFSEDVNALSLAANTAETLDIPTGANYVLFSGTADFYVRRNDTATVPGDTTDETAAELNPTLRSLAGVSSLSVIASAACVVTASFYS